MELFIEPVTSWKGPTNPTLKMFLSLFTSIAIFYSSSQCFKLNCLTGYLALFFLVAAGSPSLHQESASPHQPKKAQAVTAHSGTPVPPRYLIRGPGAALSPDVFAKDKGTPVPLSHHYIGVASSSNAVHPQQNLLAHTNYGNPNFPTINPSGAPFLPGFYSSGEHCIS